ncbi:MAG: 3'(2'),5'-bisphosphate nucleotidase CysQ [Acidimicrobiales bacterium]
MTTVSDHRLAAQVAEEVGRLLVALRAEGAGWAAGELGDEGDRRAHRRMVELLAQARPGDAVLSEEGGDDKARLGRPRVWVVDPLDGTREFGEPERTDWAVHVALVVAHLVRAGAVALPAQGVVVGTDAPPSVPGPSGRPPRVVASRSRRPAVADRVAAALGGEVVPLGSAGAKAMAVVTGAADVYVHAGGMYEWDSAAPVAVASAAGLHASRVDGSALLYNRPDPYLPDLLICRPELARVCLDALADAV